MASVVNAFVSSVAQLRGASSSAVAAAEKQREVTREQAANHAQKQRAKVLTKAANAAHVARSQAQACVEQIAPGAASAPLSSQMPVGEVDALSVAEYVRCGEVRFSGATLHQHDDIVVPYLVPLLDRGNLVIRGSSNDARIPGLLQEIVLRCLLATGPSQLFLWSYEPGLTATLAPFGTLRQAAEELVPPVGASPEDLDSMLAQLSLDVRRINDMFRGRSVTLGAFRREANQPIEDYRLVVIRDFPRGVSAAASARLSTLMEVGPRCGISFIVHHAPDVQPERDVDPHAVIASAHQVDIDSPSLAGVVAGRWERGRTVSLERLQDLVEHQTERAKRAAAPSVSFEELHRDGSAWSSSSADGITAIIGRSGHQLVEITLGDEREQRHNVLVSGAVGQGKSNLLMVLVHSLACRYSPDELQMYLLDLKEGLTLQPLAPASGRPEFLPHAQVLGLESDRTFAGAVLASLVGEFERRAAIMKQHGDNIARYRRAQPGQTMPRILVVVDEFQKLFDDADAGGSERIVADLEKLAREGRAYGIHLVLGSQTLSGINALLNKQDGIFAQFPYRLALKNTTNESRVVLDAENTEAARLRFRGEAVINRDYGNVAGNARAVIARADPAELAQLRWQLWARDPDRDPPQVFHGASPASLVDVTSELLRLRSGHRDGREVGREAVVGRQISIGGRAASVMLTREAGRHLAVLGAGGPTTRASGTGDDGSVAPPNLAIGVLQAAALSLALQHPDVPAHFVVLDHLSPPERERAHMDAFVSLLQTLGSTCKVYAGQAHTYLSGLEQLLASRTAEDTELYVLGLGLDRVNLHQQDEDFREPADGLRALLKRGPSLGAHLLGWWATARAFNDAVGFDGQGAISAIMALGVSEQELTSYMGPFVSWEFRPNRGLLYDGTSGLPPEVLVPMSPIVASTVDALLGLEWDP